MKPLYSAHNNHKLIDRSDSFQGVVVNGPGKEINTDILDMRSNLQKLLPDDPENIQLAQTYFKYIGNEEEIRDEEVVEKFKKALDITFTLDPNTSQMTLLQTKENIEKWNGFCNFKSEVKPETIFQNILEEHGVEIYKDIVSNKNNPDFIKYYKEQCAKSLGGGKYDSFINQNIDETKDWMKDNHVVTKFCYDAIDKIYEKFEALAKATKSLVSSKEEGNAANNGAKKKKDSSKVLT